MKKLTDVQYGVIMQAISIAHAEMDDNTFIDPYNNEEGLTNSNARHALQEVETMLADHYLDNKGNEAGELKPFCNICGESVHIVDDTCTACRSTDVGYTD